MRLIGLVAPVSGVPDIPLITGGTRISNRIPLSSQTLAKILVSRLRETPPPSASSAPVSAHLIPPPLSLRPRIRLRAAAAAIASHSSSRTAIPSPPSGPIRSRPRLPTSRLPVSCKRAAQTPSDPSAAEPSAHSWRTKARENRARPWLQGSVLAVKPVTRARTQSPPAAAAAGSAPVTEKSLVERRRVRQERERPWLSKGQALASRPTSFTSVTRRSRRFI